MNHLGDEQTLLENRSSFLQWYLRPRVLRPLLPSSQPPISTQTNFFGQPIRMPIFASPAGVHALCDPRHGECATATAFCEFGLPFGLSQHSTRTIEQVADRVGLFNSSERRRNPLLWYQCYILKDRRITEALVYRAIRAGYSGVFVTVDSIRFGFREADARNNFTTLPKPHRLVNYDGVDVSIDTEETKRPVAAVALGATTRLSDTYNAGKEIAWDQNSEKMFAEDVTWADITWLKESICRPHGLPLVVKGIMTPEDAELAIEAGADGIMVSNHGGRQLDGCLAAIDALPDVARCVAGRVPILMDGGVRRGTDVIKALALGATAVGLGKPMFFALAVNGQQGVTSILEILRKELESAMAICGCASIEDITPNLVMRHPFHRDATHPLFHARL